MRLSENYLLIFVSALVLGFVLLVHSFITSHEVPSGLRLDCPAAQVLDPVTHTCGGV